MSKRNREKRAFSGVFIPYLLRNKYRLNDGEIELIIYALKHGAPAHVCEFLNQGNFFAEGKNRNPAEKKETLDTLMTFLAQTYTNSLFVTLYSGAIVAASAQEYLKAINVRMEGVQL